MLKNSIVRGEVVYMRKNFFDLLRDSEVDINRELQKLKSLFSEKCCYFSYKEYSLYDLISDDFLECYKRREHFLSLKELLDSIEVMSFGFSEYDKYFLFAEMYIDLFSVLDDYYDDNVTRQKKLIRKQINKIINSLGYKFINTDDRVIIVEDNVFANESAQIVTEFADVKEALSILEYNHFSNKGNIERKKEILKKIADLLEPWRKPLNKSSELKDLLKAKNDKIQALEKLFYMYNKFNIRHNNEDQMLTGLSNQEIESWYDKIYTMSLFVILGKDVAQILADFNEFVD